MGDITQVVTWANRQFRSHACELSLQKTPPKYESVGQYQEEIMKQMIDYFTG